MQAHARADDAYFLNAIVVHDHSPQSRTDVLSSVNFDLLLDERLAVITIAPRSALRADWLWDVFIDKPDLFGPLLEVPHHTDRWMLYLKHLDHDQFQFKKLIDDIDRFAKEPMALLETGSAQVETYVVALVPEAPWSMEHKDVIRRALDTAFNYTIRVTKGQAKTDDDEASDRERLIRIRKEMLEKVGSYTSEDLAAAADSITSNPSQFAADQRSTGRLFGVRFGQAWHYPKFQFDSKRNIIPEMKDVLTALSPDEQGWDRLQWFLEPHEKLKGRTPLEVWKTDRKRVIVAANVERWNGRD